MKEVTFKGAKDGTEYGGVQVGENYYPLDQAVVVSNADAEELEKHSGSYKFSVKDAPKGSRSQAQESAQGESDQPDVDTGGPGGSQTPSTSSQSTGVSAARSGPQR